MSIAVIALVVWLLLVFLSVTEGIEKQWVHKLTSLNGPLRITPKNAYYNSYYYKVDTLSVASDYKEKTIREKLAALNSDPYNPDEDAEIPPTWQRPEKNPDNSLIDPVKLAAATLNELKNKHPSLVYQDFELSGAMMRLQLTRDETTHETQSYLTQASYLASFADKNPYLASLILKPSPKDLNHLLYLTEKKNSSLLVDESESLVKNSKEDFRLALASLLDTIKITTLQPRFSHWKLPSAFIPEKESFQAVACLTNDKITHITINDQKEQNVQYLSSKEGKITKKDGQLFFENTLLPPTIPLLVNGKLLFKAALIPSSLEKASHLKDVKFAVETTLQNKPLKGSLSWDGLEIATANPENTFLEHMLLSQENGVLLAKSFQESGVKTGDTGYLAYSSATASSLQEQRIPICVAGFYDPGIMAVGNKCILVPNSITKTINSSSNSTHFDPTESNGILVWFKDLKEAEKIKAELIASFEEKGIAKYWKVSTYKEYDFAKDLMQQFQSDKYLFTMVGIIILIVACSNIISLLIILVNDKKKEIGILQSMGASSKSIALIFSASGIVMGVLGSMIGILGALLTLHNIDSVVKALSFIQGHSAFNAAFWGESLPSHLSESALVFILISTPLISLFAALIPALKACKTPTSSTLRSE